jgi:hypothetical protein
MLSCDGVINLVCPLQTAAPQIITATVKAEGRSRNQIRFTVSLPIELVDHSDHLLSSSFLTSDERIGDIIRSVALLVPKSATASNNANGVANLEGT